MKDCPKSFAVYSITALAVAFLLVFSPLTSDQMDYIYRHMSNYQKEEVQRFAEVFKALSNPNRLHIFLRLVSCCPPGTKCISDAAVQRCVGELGQGLEIDPSTVSHHLKELRRQGSSAWKGEARTCCVGLTRKRYSQWRTC